MLRLEQVSAYYGDVRILHDVWLEVRDGEIVSLVGANAAGKSTLLQAISGLLDRVSGTMEFDGLRIDELPSHRIVGSGIVQIPEGRRLFPFMTVQENLELGAYTAEARQRKDDTLEEVFSFLPVLKERRKQLAGTLSGGEQQMLAIGRGMMALPKLLMLDEPSLGLAPLLVGEVFETVQEINRRGTAILLVEQNVHHALRMANRGYVLENGRIVLEGPGEDLLADEALRKAYMGM